MSFPSTDVRACLSRPALVVLPWENAKQGERSTSREHPAVPRTSRTELRIRA